MVVSRILYGFLGDLYVLGEGSSGLRRVNGGLGDTNFLVVRRKRPRRIDSRFSDVDLLGEVGAGPGRINGGTGYGDVLFVNRGLGTSAIFTFDTVNGAEVRLVVTINFDGSLSVRARRLGARRLVLELLVRSVRSIGGSFVS